MPNKAMQRVVEGEPPLERVGGVRRPADVEQAPPAVVGDEMRDEGGCAGEVIGCHHARIPANSAGTRAARRLTTEATMTV